MANHKSAKKRSVQSKIKNAVNDLRIAFEKDLLPNSLTDEKYFNIRRMQSIKLS